MCQKQTSCAVIPRLQPSAHVAVVDDETSVRRALERLLRASGFRVTGYPSAEAFLERDPPEAPDCLVLDIRLPGMSGTDLQATLAARGEPIPTVVITAHDDPRTRARSLTAGAAAYLTKPFDEWELIGAIQQALDGGQPGPTPGLTP